MENTSKAVPESRGYWSEPAVRITRDPATNPFHPHNFPKLTVKEFDRTIKERGHNDLTAKDVEVVGSVTIED